MELFKQEMELFYQLPDLWSKNLFYKMSLILNKEFIIDLKTGNGIIQKGNGIMSPASCPLSKPCFTRLFTFSPRSLKLIIKTGNKIIQTGNGIISRNSRPLSKKLLLQSVSHFHQGIQNRF